VWVSEGGGWAEMVKQMVAKGKKSVSELGKVLWNKEVSVEVKMRLWEAVGESRMKYGSEVWWADKAQQRGLARVELEWGKKVLGVGKSTSDVFVRGELGLRGVVAKGEEMRLRWLGRLVVMRASSWPKKVFEVEWEKKVGVGGLRRRGWKVVSERLVKKYGLCEVLEQLKRGECRLEEWYVKVGECVELECQREWREKVVGAKKLELYAKVKEQWGMVRGVRGVRTKGGVLRSRLRSGTVGLGVEVGRFRGREGQSLCKRCGLCVETVVHVVDECGAYQEEREEWRRSVTVCVGADCVREGEVWRWVLGDESLGLSAEQEVLVREVSDVFLGLVREKRWGGGGEWTANHRVESMENSKAPLF